mgnify:CR=1 FL=1
MLGLFLGLLGGTVLTSAVARPMVTQGGTDIPVGIGPVFGSIMPVLGVVGAVAAVLIDQKVRRSR